MVRIVFSKVAKFDLKEIVEYIKRGSVRYALLEKQYIVKTIDQLSLQPEIGKVFNENPNLRELVFRNYRIIYQIVSDSQIHILTIHHHARSITNNPAFNAED